MKLFDILKLPGSSDRRQMKSYFLLDLTYQKPVMCAVTWQRESVTATWGDTIQALFLTWFNKISLILETKFAAVLHTAKTW